MGKVGKVAIGCLIVTFLGLVAVVAGIGGLAWWGKGKIQEMAGPALESARRIGELEQRANQNPFTRPTDGVIAEDRLLKFLQARERVFGVYEKNKPFFEATAQKKQADLSVLTKGSDTIGEIRYALAEALVDVGMNTEEYAFIASAIYQSAWAASIADGTGGKSVSEATEGALDEAQKQLEATKNPEAAKAAEALQDLRDTTVELSQAADVPKANLELFRKHETEIRKYAMAGLELVGL